MAGSFAEARAQILSLQPAVLRAKAGEVRSFGSASVSAGSTLRASADRLGARRGAPYQAYQERLTPTAGWLTGLSPLSNDTAATLVNAAQAGERAQMVLAQQEEALARFGVNPSTTPAAFAAAEAQALAALNTAIADVTQAYGVITPVTPTAAPVVANTAGGAGTGGGSAATGLNGVGGAVGTSAGGLAGGVTSGAASGAGTAGAAGGAGPTSGPFAGFVQDPTTGNLIDPATGRQADAGGRFLDPITGQPFGPASPFVSRLEGLDGGVSPVGGLLGGTAGPGASVGAVAPGLAGAPAGVGAGGVGLVAGGALPFLAGGGAGAGFAASRGRAGSGSAGSGSIAALYGGVVPPSLAGRNPAAAQLRQQAAENLSTMAGTARRYSAIASGQAPGAYLPPMAGAGAGAAGGGGAGRPRGRSLPRTGEPASVWGAAPGAGGRPDRRRPPSRSTAEVEDDEVWNGGTTVPSLLEGR